MNPIRYTGVDVVHDDRFISLSPIDKLCYLYFWSTADHVGIVDVVPILVQRILGLEDPFDINKFIEECNSYGEPLAIKISGGKKLFLTFFLEINQKKKSQVLYLNPNDPVQRSILDNINAYHEANEWLEGEIEQCRIVIGKSPENKHTARAKLTKATKDAVKRLDEFKCAYCGIDHDLQVDHINPIGMGGDSNVDNLATSCGTCNRKKGKNSVLEFVEKSKLKPSKRLLNLLLKSHSENEYLRGFKDPLKGLERGLNGSGKQQERGSSESKVKVKVSGIDTSVEDYKHSTLPKHSKEIKESSELENPFSEDFIPVWNSWKKYKASQFKFNYKSVATEQAAIEKLTQLSNGIEKNAIEIINESIANGWKGLFKKTQQNGNSKKGHRLSPEQQATLAAMQDI